MELTIGCAIVFVALLAICITLSYLWQLEYDKNQTLTGIIDAALREFASGKPIGDNLRKTLPGVVATMSNNLRAASEELDKLKATIANQKEVIQKLERSNLEKSTYGDRLHVQTIELRKELAEAKVKADRFEQSCKSCDVSFASYKESLATATKELDSARKEIETLQLQNSGLLESIEDRDELSAEQVKNLLNEIDRLKNEIRSNLEAKRPKPWKNFLSNLVNSESNQS